MKKMWILKGIGIAIVFVGVAGFAVMSLWNWLVPAIFGLTVITFTQALGLLVLSKILFGGFRGGGSWGGGHRQGFWKNRMFERWGKLSPEEREKMKAKWGRHWGDKFEEMPSE